MVTIDFVVPVYSGEHYLERLAKEVSRTKAEFDASDRPFRISKLIFVNDAAVDGSGEILDRIGSRFEWIEVLHLSRNFGQHPATIAGILASEADWVATIDEDLQHPPDHVEGLLARAAATSADVVYVQPERHVHGGVFRDLSSRTYKGLIDRVTGNPMIRKANSFRLLRGDLARAAAGTCGPDTYLDIALGWYTTRIETEPMILVDERHAQHGASGYNMRRLLSHARRLAISSQVKTLRFVALVGLVVFGLSIVGAILLLGAQAFTDMTRAVQGWTSLVLLISLLNGITLMLLGVATEYISLLVLRAHGKPAFFVVDRSADARLSAYFRQRANGEAPAVTQASELVSGT